MGLNLSLWIVLLNIIKRKEEVTIFNLRNEEPMYITHSIKCYHQIYWNIYFKKRTKLLYLWVPRTLFHTLFSHLFSFGLICTKPSRISFLFSHIKIPFFFSKIIHELTQCYVYVGIGQLVPRAEGRAVRRGIKATCLQEGALGWQRQDIDRPGKAARMLGWLHCRIVRSQFMHGARLCFVYVHEGY